MEKHSRVYAEIDLDAISYNMEQNEKEGWRRRKIYCRK